MDPLASPEAAELAAAVTAVYDAFSQYRVSGQLEVCQCPVCMAEEIRQEIIRTPVRDLSVMLIGEYSNSAHGVPNNTDDLKALLPRYLDLIAQGLPADQNQVGVELSRFGDAMRDGSLKHAPAEAAALTGWMRALIAHAARCAREGDDFEPLVYWFEVLICGGWPVAEVLAEFDARFDAAETGCADLAGFAAGVEQEFRYGRRIWFALGRASQDDRAAVADWLNGPAMKARLEAAFLAETSETGCDALYALLDRAGTFDAGSFGDGRDPA